MNALLTDRVLVPLPICKLESYKIGGECGPLCQQQGMQLH